MERDLESSDNKSEADEKEEKRSEKVTLMGLWYF